MTGTDLEAVDFLVPASGDAACPRGAAAARRGSRSSRSSRPAPTGSRTGCRRRPRSAALAARATGRSPSGSSARCSGASSWLCSSRARANAGSPARSRTSGAGRCVIVGMGSIGRRVGEHLRGFGSEVVGVGSHAHDGLHGPDELASCCRRPTPSSSSPRSPTPTRGLIGRAELAALPDGAVVVNAARGPVVDAAALARRGLRPAAARGARRHRPRAAARRTTRSGAPPARSRSPRTSPATRPPDTPRAAALAGDQLARWAAGEPLANVVRAGT